MRVFRLFDSKRPRPRDFIAHFTTNYLPDVLAGIGRAPVAKIEPFPFGRHRSVYRLDLSDGSSLVLRAHVDPENRRGFTHRHLNRYLRERGFCVPTIHFSGHFPFPGGKSSVEVLIEDFVEGQPPERGVCDDPPTRRQMAEVLCRLHSDCAPRPGKPWLGKQDVELVEVMAAKAPVLLDRIRAQLSEVTAQQANRCLLWIREAMARRPVPQSFELIYGGFDSYDLLVTPRGEIALIDSGSISYDCYETDLVDARWGFLGQEWWEGFCEDYFTLAPFRRKRFNQLAPLFFARFYLNTAASRAVRARKKREKGHSAAAEFYRAESRRFWNLLLDVVEGRSLS